MGETLRQHAEEYHELRRHHGELRGELADVEGGHERIREELQAVLRGTSEANQEIGLLEHRVCEERARSEADDASARSEHEELAVLEQQVARVTRELEDVSMGLEEERSEGEACDDRIHEEAAQQSQYRSEITALTAEVEDQRRENSEELAAYNEHEAEVQCMRHQLQADEAYLRQEEQDFEAGDVHLTRLKAEVVAMESLREDATSEVANLEKSIEELEERCDAQKTWRDEFRLKQNSTEVALEHHREELGLLASDGARLRQEVDEVTRERMQLEIEVQIATPALEEVRHRCSCLQDRLASRIREFTDEAEKLRRFRGEAGSARTRVAALEFRNGQLNARLRERHEPAAPRRGCIGGPPEEPLCMGDTGLSQTQHSQGPWLQHGDTGLSQTQHSQASWLQKGDSGYPPQRHPPMSPPSLRPPPLASPGGPGTSWSMSSLRRRSPEPGRGGIGTSQTDAEAVRFLCEYVAREEERLGLTPRRVSPTRSPSPPSLGTRTSLAYG